MTSDNNTFTINVVVVIADFNQASIGLFAVSVIVHRTFFSKNTIFNQFTTLIKLIRARRQQIVGLVDCTRSSSNQAIVLNVVIFTINQDKARKSLHTIDIVVTIHDAIINAREHRFTNRRITVGQVQNYFIVTISYCHIKILC